MEGPRLTEERLRNHLDSNQVMRERMCLALLPLLGPFSGERPRRPKGGPDGGRDIEAIYEGSTAIWCGVGFQNGAGRDDASRTWADNKFKEDLQRAREENPQLQAFAFFTNVDLTPSGVESMKTYAQERAFTFIDVFDLERLRHALDSPEGLIARLQYLDIPMSTTEQISLVSKFGSQMQNAITSRFDRVEETLAKMEQFLEFQKPICQYDIFVDLTEVYSSELLNKKEAVFISVEGLASSGDAVNFLQIIENGFKGTAGKPSPITDHAYSWLSGHTEVSSTFCLAGPSQRCIMSFFLMEVIQMRHKVRIIDLTYITAKVWCTRGLSDVIERVRFTGNNFQLFTVEAKPSGPDYTLTWPDQIPHSISSFEWIKISEKMFTLSSHPPKKFGST